MVTCFGLGQPRPCVLDLYSAGAAFSFRKLRAAYTGYAVKVRRSSDNAQQDIGFTPDGDFNLIAYAAFVGAGTGYVVTWYDQTGNGRHATQSDAALQFPIVLNSINGLPALGRTGAAVANSRMTMASPLSTTSHWTSFNVVRNTSTTARGYLHGQDASSSKSYLFLDYQFNLFKTSANNGETGYTNNAFSNAIRNALFVERYNTPANDVRAYENGVLMGNTSLSISKRVEWLFASYTSTSVMNNILCSELIFFNTLLNTLDYNTISTDIGGYYGLF